MNFDKVILHIGRHKSGTSSIQLMLHLNKKHFDSQGILYPLAGRDKNTIAHHKLALDFKGKGARKAIDKFANELKKEYRSHHSTLVVSSEAFQNVVDSDVINYFFSKIPHKKKIVICYIREFLDYTISSFRQKVQNQSNFDIFPTYVTRPNNMAGFVNRWQKIGGFRARWFSSDGFLNNDLIQDFLQLAEIDYDPALKTPRANPSLGGNLLVLKLMANYLNVDFLSYKEMERKMNRAKRFSLPFHVSDDDAEFWRGRYGYNNDLVKTLGEIKLKSWEQFNVFPDQNLIKDFNLIKDNTSETLSPILVKSVGTLNTSGWL